MAYNREYATGRVRTLTARGRLILHQCGGISVPSDLIHIGGGWQGSDYFKVFDPTDLQRHSISGGAAFAPPITIETGIETSNPHREPGDPADGYTFVTRITDGNGETVVTWVNDGDPDWDNDEDHSAFVTPSEDIYVDFTSTLIVHEWVKEIWTASLRPSHPHEIQKIYFYKPLTNKVSTHLTYNTGGTDYISDPVLSNHVDRSDILSENKAGYDFLDNSDENSAFGITAGMNYKENHEEDLPFPNAVIGEVTGASLDGSLYWFGFDGRFTVDMDEAVEKAGFPFYAVNPGQADGALNTKGFQDYRTFLSGGFRDFENTVPATAATGLGEQFPTPASGRIVATGKIEGKSPDNLGVVVPAAYNPTDYQPIIREGSEFNALSISHAAETVIDTFIRSYPAGNEWTVNDCVKSIESSSLKAVAGGSDPFVTRNLRNDFNDISYDLGIGPTAWYAAHSGELTAAQRAWWTGDVGGPTIALAGPGQWVKIGKKLRSESDVFNWSSYRYLYLTAKADTACDVEVTVTYDNFNMRADYGDSYFPERISKTVTFSVTLSTAFVEHEIDLPSLVDGDGSVIGHNAPRSVKSIKIAFPSGRTIWLKKLSLKEKAKAVIEVHLPSVEEGLGSVPTEDLGFVAANVDGMKALYINAAPSPIVLSKSWPTWAFPVKQFEPGDVTIDYPSSVLMKTLAAEISLQEGWTATDLSPSGTFAIWLKETFNQNSPATLKAQRGYGAIADSPKNGNSREFDAQLGHGVRGLVFDPDTHTPVSTTVIVDDPPDGSYDTLEDYPDGITLDSAVSRTNGTFEHQLKKVQGVEFRSSPNTANEIIYLPPFPVTGPGGTDFVAQPITTYGRIVLWVAFGGKAAEATSGNPWIVVGNGLENYVSLIKDDALQLARMRGAETDWNYNHVATGLFNPSIAKNERKTDYPLYIAGHIAGGKVVLLKNTHYGSPTGLWSIKVIADGSHAVVNVEESLGLLFVSYWRLGNFYIRKSSDEGATWRNYASSGTAEATVKTSVPEQHFSFDFLNNTKRTIIGVYTDGAGALQTLRSDDLGDTWT